MMYWSFRPRALENQLNRCEFGGNVIIIIIIIIIIQEIDNI